MKSNFNTRTVLCILSIFTSVTASATVTVKPCGGGTTVTLTPPVTVGDKIPAANASGGANHSTQTIGAVTYCCKNNTPVEPEKCEPKKPKPAANGTAKSFAPATFGDDTDIFFGR